MTAQTEQAASAEQADQQYQDFVREWEEWHADRDRNLADPHGFLAVTSLNWLDAEPARFSDAPGAWSTGPEGIVVELAEDEELLLDGEPLRGRHNFGVLEERASLYVTAGKAVIEVAKRGGHDIVRPRHPDNPLVVGFTRTPVYPADPRWALTGRYLPFDVPRPVTVGAAVEGLQHVYDAPGQVEFELPDGGTHRLTVFNGHRGSLQALFTDATSGVTTYAANRGLTLPEPDAEGRVTVDFNRAHNLPCAYTDLATCPLPPAENRLPVAVEAGAKTPYERTGQR